MTRWLPLVVALLGSCSGDDDTAETEDTESDTDTDTDTDSDTESDTDSDTDTDTDCIPLCDAVSCTLDLDLDTVSLSGSLAWNGQAIADAGAGPEVFLQLVGPGELLYMLDAASSYDVRVIPGTYDVYVWTDWGAVADPAAGRYKAADDLDLSADTVLDIDPPVATLSGDLSYDGAPIGDVWANWEWELTFVGDWGAGSTLTMDGGSTYTAAVVPGTYDVWFHLTRSDAVARPVPGAVRLAEGLVVTGDMTFDIALTLGMVSGSASYDGAIIEDDEATHDWTLFFRDPLTGEEHSAGVPGGSSDYQVPMYEGTWDVDFRLREPGAVTTPVLVRTRIADGVVLDGSATLDFAVTTTTLSGSLTYDGEVVGGGGTGLSFQNQVTGDSFWRPVAGGEASYSEALFPGTWDVYFNLQDPGAVTYPVSHAFTAALDLAVAGPTTLDVAPVTAALAGEMWFDGQQLPGDEGGGWSLRFEDTAGHPLDVGVEPVYAVRLYEGPWDVSMRVAQPQMHGTIPGWHRVATDLPVTGTTTLDLDLQPRGVGGSLSWGDGDVAGWYELFLVDADGSEPVRLDGAADSYAINAWPGRYAVRVGIVEPFPPYTSYSLPPFEIARCVEIAADPSPWSHTIAVDGDLSDWRPVERFATSQGDGTATWITWDADNLYLALEHPDVATGGDQHFVVIYVGNGAAGTRDGLLHNTQQPLLPFDATHAVRWKADDSWSALDAWNGAAWEIVEAPYLDGQLAKSGEVVELSVPLADLGVTGVLQVHVSWLFEGTGAESSYAATPAGSFAQGAYDPDYTRLLPFDVTGTLEPAVVHPVDEYGY